MIAFSKQTLEQYRQEAIRAQGLTDEDYERYSPTASYTATAYHRAAGASGREGDLGSGIILRNHYRSVAPIASYFSRYYPDGLIVKTPSDSTLVGSCLIAYNVSGSELNQTNPEEIAAISTIINSLPTTARLPPTIGVISPYRQQSFALQRRLIELFPHLSAKDIGTVHTFQGAERDIIILSTRQCHPHHSLRFLNRRPNLLNVAVSRTKKLFILVGNLEHLSQSGGYTGDLVEHIRQLGEVRSLP